jgi:MSHA biogenesis protein MshL
MFFRTAACLVLVSWAGTGRSEQPPLGQLPPLPLTQLDDRSLAADLDNRTFTLTFAQPVSIKDLLLLLVRGTALSVIPDPNADGSFIGELKNVTVRQALGLILPPLGLDYSLDRGFIRVFRRERETRIFEVNVAAVERSATSTVGVGEPPRSVASVSTSVKADEFSELARGVQALLSDNAAYNLDRKAGLLQVTDFPERLDRVAAYLEAVHDRVHRQVQVDARVVEVELADEKAEGIDWSAVAARLVGDLTPAERAAPRTSLTGLRVTDVARLLSLLTTQGRLMVVADPRLLTLNNEPAVVRTEGVTLSVTPQIGGDGAVTLALSPIVRTPALAESDMIARVADGETLVIWGFIRDRETRERRNVGIAGGWFGRGTVVTRRKVEMVLLLTPKVVPGVNVR